MKKKFVLVTFVSLFLAACSSTPQKKTSTTSTSTTAPTASSINQYKSTPPLAGDNSVNSLAATKYVQDKQAIPQTISVSSTNNACVDGFNFLKGLSQTEFDQYTKDYNKISQNYNFLSVNKNIMDGDTKSILSMTLNKKLDTLCTKVQYSGFISVKEKLKSLSGI